MGGLSILYDRGGTTTPKKPTTTKKPTVTTTPLDMWHTDPAVEAQKRDAWLQSTEAARIAGLDPMGTDGTRYAQQYLNNINNSAYQAAHPQSLGAASGGGGGGAGVSDAATNAIQQLWAYMNRPQPNLTGQINQAFQGAQQTGTDALSQLVAGLQGQQNPYAGVNIQMPQVAENPLAQYMQASGTSSASTDALHALLSSTAQQTNQADQSMLAKMQQAWGANQQAQIGNAQQAGAQFQQGLASQQAGYLWQEQQRQQQAKEQLMSQLLQMAVGNNVNLGSLGIKF